MKNNIIGLANSLPTLIQNTHLNVNLQGWPAAAAVIAICSAGVTVYFIKASHSGWDSSHTDVA